MPSRNRKKRCKQRAEYLQKREDILSQENKAKARERYKADPEKKKASIRDTYNANAVSKRAAKRQRYQEDVEENRAAKRQRYQEGVEENRAAKRQRYQEGVEENRAAKRQRYQEGVEENRAAKRQRYQEGVEENRAANRWIYRGNSVTIKAARRSRYWKGRRTTTTTQSLTTTSSAAPANASPTTSSSAAPASASPTTSSSAAPANASPTISSSAAPASASPTAPPTSASPTTMASSSAAPPPELVPPPPAAPLPPPVHVSVHACMCLCPPLDFLPTSDSFKCASCNHYGSSERHMVMVIHATENHENKEVVPCSVQTLTNSAFKRFFGVVNATEVSRSVQCELPVSAVVSKSMGLVLENPMRLESISEQNMFYVVIDWYPEPDSIDRFHFVIKQELLQVPEDSQHYSAILTTFKASIQGNVMERGPQDLKPAEKVELLIQEAFQAPSRNTIFPFILALMESNVANNHSITADQVRAVYREALHRCQTLATELLMGVKNASVVEAWNDFVQCRIMASRDLSKDKAIRTYPYTIDPYSAF
eukprot:Em0016g972a